MQKRRLGRTGHESTLVIFGGAAFWEIDEATAHETLDLVLESGINHIDVAPQYGDAEDRMGTWLPPHRDKFFLGCKTMERTADGAWAEMHRSFEKLHIDSFDLYQMHAVTSLKGLDEALGKGGAIEAFVRARDEGLTKYLGITGHGLQAPVVFQEALKRFDFDTVMFPLNPRLFAMPDYRAEAEKLLAMAQERDVGVMIIKSMAKGLWGEREKQYLSWYEPWDQQDKINEGVRFALSQPGVTAIASAGDVRLLPKVLKAAEAFEPLDEDDREALISAWADLEPIFPGPVTMDD
jgi:aryl-alcohol dehydrogenase-like predicted oxidoreductase